MYEIARLSETLDIFHAFATWKGKSALDIVTDWNSLGFLKGILTFQLVSYRGSLILNMSRLQDKKACPYFSHFPMGMEGVWS